MKIFTGFDQREAQGWHVFAQSIIETTPGAELSVLPAMQGDGSNAFTYSRFLVPSMMGFKGWALFCDGVDMLALTDLNALTQEQENRFAVMVVKHDYKTKFPRKYVGTPMESPNRDYPRKNWSSLILWNCGHRKNKKIPMSLDGSYLHRFGWLEDEDIGELGSTWNWLADEYGENPDAKLLHWTAGIPGFTAYRDAPMAALWHAAKSRI